MRDDKTALFDSHAHYDDKRFDSVRDETINEIIKGGEVQYILNAASDIETSRTSAELSCRYEMFYASAGIHPHECGRISASDEQQTLKILRKLLDGKKTVAVGEIGLDFYYDHSERAQQIKWFKLQMELAAQLGYPVIVHDREAHGPCLEVVRAFPLVKGVFHSFSGSAEMAAELVRMGWYISFSGVVTFKNASRILEVVKAVPANRLLIETDCPYLAPHPMRGKLNHSGYLKYTAQTVANIRGVTYGEICRATLDNACRIYNIM